MSQLFCEHSNLYRDTSAYYRIHANFIACSTPTARFKKIRSCFCSICKTRSHRLHACLMCKFVGCFDRKHFHAHVESSDHHMGVDVSFGNVYCFKCNDYIYDNELTDLKFEKFPGSWQLNESKASLPVEYQSSREKRSKEFLGLRGLVRSGQTCYVVCIVQVLMHDPLLRNYFLSDKHNSFTCRLNCDHSICLACEMFMLFQEFYSGESIPLSPHQLIYIIWNRGLFNSLLAQDAHEYFTAILEALHQDLRDCPEGAESKCKCIVHKTHTGLLQSDVRCLTCQEKRTKFEEFRNISLDFGKKCSEISLKDCLEGYTQPELLPGACDNCKQHTIFKKQLTIKELPDVITFHLKRIDCDKKITTHVTFPEYLDMTPFISSMRGTSSKVCENDYNPLYTTDNNYSLFAVVQHVGDGESGHYITFIRMKQKWYQCDDECIFPTKLDIVLENEAYLLFYHKERIVHEKD